MSPIPYNSPSDRPSVTITLQKLRTNPRHNIKTSDHHPISSLSSVFSPGLSLSQISSLPLLNNRNQGSIHLDRTNNTKPVTNPTSEPTGRARAKTTPPVNAQILCPHTISQQQQRSEPRNQANLTATRETSRKVPSQAATRPESRTRTTGKKRHAAGKWDRPSVRPTLDIQGISYGMASSQTKPRPLLPPDAFNAGQSST